MPASLCRAADKHGFNLKDLCTCLGQQYRTRNVQGSLFPSHLSQGQATRPVLQKTRYGPDKSSQKDYKIKCNEKEKRKTPDFQFREACEVYSGSVRWFIGGGAELTCPLPAPCSANGTIIRPLRRGIVPWATQALKGWG
ncbi:hypothetical protein E2C01_093024 [Portunus trituberculatus]|uniref:Uncharacterized protein n=1 Tax=Portunus trituberculatus TaxID=210409 RepID=A0A5B7JS89_PORTR|nr:hypothetical protein [Portunus trituberculatus]